MREEPTEEPMAEPTEEMMAFEGMKVEAPDCDYGGILKSIEAVDAYTVVFTTCVPDPGFPAKAAFSAFQIQSSAYLESPGARACKRDGIDNVAPDVIATVQADPALQLTPREAFNIFYVGMNNTYAPFDNEQVRQAIAMAIDRPRVGEIFFP